MTAWILGVATAILLAMMLWRNSSREFKRRSEEPKFRFLANLRLGSHSSTGPVDSDRENQTTPQRNNHEKHEP